MSEEHHVVESVEEPVEEKEEGVQVEEIIEDAIVRSIEEANRYKQDGNALYAKQDYAAAILSYKMSLSYCPLDDEYNKDRAIFFCNMAAAQLELEQYEEAIANCTRAIELNPSYVKGYIRRYQGYFKSDKLDEALADLGKVLELDPSSRVYQNKRNELSKMIDERNEKLKAEMLGKLKDVGNKILGKFGMSLDNFKMVPDPATGGYNIKFEKCVVC